MANAKLDKLITDYSLFLEKQTRDALDPRASALGSLLRMTFRTVVTGDVLLSKIYDAAGWRVADGSPDERLADMAALAEKSGNTATADRLRKSMAAIDATAAAAGESIPANTGVYAALKQMKKSGVAF